MGPALAALAKSLGKRALKRGAQTGLGFLSNPAGSNNQEGSEGSNPVVGLLINAVFMPEIAIPILVVLVIVGIILILLFQMSVDGSTLAVPQLQ